jgi:hypothetical protein
LKPVILPSNGENLSFYCDAWSAKPSDIETSQTASDKTIQSPPSDIDTDLIQLHSSPSVNPELQPAKEDQLNDVGSDTSDQSSKPGSPGNVLKIVESWEGNIDEYNFPGKESKSPSSKGGTIESPRSDSSSGFSGTSDKDNPWKPPGYNMAPQPLPGMVKSSIYSLARNINLDPSFESENNTEENVYDFVAPVSKTEKKKPSPYDPPWSDDYTDPNGILKGDNPPATATGGQGNYRIT